MIKSGTLKPALLLALIAVIVIALAEPIAGHMMGQGNMMGQRSMMIYGPKKSYDTISNINVLFNQITLNLSSPFKNTFYFCLKINFISLKIVKFIEEDV